MKNFIFIYNVLMRFIKNESICKILFLGDEKHLSLHEKLPSLSFSERQILYQIFVAQEYLFIFGFQNKLKGRILAIEIKICKKVLISLDIIDRDLPEQKPLHWCSGAKFFASRYEMRLQLNLTGNSEPMDLKLDIKEKHQLSSEWRYNNQSFGIQKKL